MAAVYRPTEAISLFRASLVLPRIQPASARRARAAFSTSRPAHSTPSSTPPPPPPRRSITLTGDTGRVRWTELSPGEKVVRTTQQSFNLVVVAVGVIATVATPAATDTPTPTPTQHTRTNPPRAQ
jgi:import inner membrane translocase subunit TIM21